MKRILISISLLTLCFAVVGCAQNVSPNTYNGSEVGVVSKVKKGVVVSRRVVLIDNNSGAGGLAGAAAGAAGGSTLGSGASTNIVGAIGGAVVGGVIGNAVDKGLNQHKGFEYIIKLNDGQTISVVQSLDMHFAVKQHVMVIYGAMTRIIPDDVSSPANAHAHA